MSKGIIVVNVPENCLDCPMGNLNWFVDGGDSGVYCQLNKKINIPYERAETERPVWCPIKQGEDVNRWKGLDKQGRVLKLPCDTVYFICDKNSKYAHVRSKSISELYIFEIEGIDKEGRYWSKKEFAEAALKEMGGNHE